MAKMFKTSYVESPTKTTSTSKSWGRLLIDPQQISQGRVWIYKCHQN